MLSLRAHPSRQALGSVLRLEAMPRCRAWSRHIDPEGISLDSVNTSHERNENKLMDDDVRSNIPTRSMSRQLVIGGHARERRSRENVNP
jgi:hypothetical protein